MPVCLTDCHARSQACEPHPSSCRIALIAALHPHTGNGTTACRLVRVLQQAWGAHDAVSIATIDCDSVAACDIDFIAQSHAIVCLHAYRAGRVLLACSHASARVVVVLGGTDVNEYVRPGSPTYSVEHVHTVATVLAQAAAVVAFTPALRDACASFASSSLPSDTSIHARTHIIPQSVLLPDDAVWRRSYDEQRTVAARARCSATSLRTLLRLAPDAVLLLLPCGLREVKDPLFAVEAIRRWRATSDVNLAIVGPPLQDACAAAVRTCAGVTAHTPHGGEAGVWLLPPVEQAQLLQWMMEADVVLNTSQSEGMSNAIVEAMAVGTPVVARCNDGNSTVLRSGLLGVLYDTPDECALECRHVVAALAAEGDWPPARAAYEAVRDQYAFDSEVSAWRAMLTSIGVIASVR